MAELIIENISPELVHAYAQLDEEARQQIKQQVETLIATQLQAPVSTHKKELEQSPIYRSPPPALKDKVIILADLVAVSNARRI